MADSSIQTPSVSIDSVSSPEAYTRLLPEILAVTELIHITIDVMLAVTTVMGAVPKLRALRPTIARTFAELDFARFDDLDDYARALQHAHVLYVKATRPPEAMPELVEQATKVRDLLHSDALALVKRGLLDPEAFKDVKRFNGHRPLAVDLQVLASAMKENLAQISAKTAVQPEELELAISLSDRLVDAIGQKDAAPTEVAEATMIRRKAFSLLARVYEDARRAVLYVRHREGDADSITPSLYASRQTSARPREDEPAADGSAAATPVTTTTPALTPANTNAPAPANSIPIGLPGSSPFMRS